MSRIAGTTYYSRGDVVLVHFPYTDRSGFKQRPALIISANWYTAQSTDVIVLAITSKVPPSPTRDEYVLSAIDWKSGGLLAPSTVKCGKILTLNVGLVIRRLGALPPQTVSSIMFRVQQVTS